MGDIIHIKLGQNLANGRSERLGRLLNRLRNNMELAVWRTKNRSARSANNPDKWDWPAIEQLEQDYEKLMQNE